MNVTNLIADAVYKSLQDREQNPDINPTYQNYALYELNLILDEQRDNIPFAEFLVYNDIADLVATPFWSVANVSYIINGYGNPSPIQAPLTEVTLSRFIEIQNVIRLKGIPEFYYWDELAQTIQVYPLPSNPVYSFTVWGRKANNNLTLMSEIPSNIPPFMYNYLVHELAFRLCAEFGVEFDEKKNETRLKLLARLEDKKDIDVSAPRNCVFGMPNVSRVPTYPWFYYVSGGT